MRSIKIIRAAHDTDEARARLMRRFKLSQPQTDAILDMALKRLAALERRKIEDEYKEKLALIKSLETLLAAPKKMRDADRGRAAGQCARNMPTSAAPRLRMPARLKPRP